MKGMALEYVFVVIVAVVAIVVGISMLTNIISPGIIPPMNQVVDVKYACAQYNETKITFENLKTLLYGFLTDQCKYFVGELKETATIDDLKRAAKEINKNIAVVVLSSCELPTISAHNLYIYCNSTLEKDKTFNITRKEIKYSDVLICQWKKG
jgi:hypothetical protein